MSNVISISKKSHLGVFFFNWGLNTKDISLIGLLFKSTTYLVEVTSASDEAPYIVDKVKKKVN